MQPLKLRATNLTKTFVLHLQHGIQLPVLEQVDLALRAGDCVVLNGSSGCGKSTLLRCLYGNYRTTEGRIELRHRERWVDLSMAAPRTILEVRRETVGYVSQFLRAIPRVPALDLVAEPLRAQGVAHDIATERAADLLADLHLPERLWRLPPATFSGGEQQRVNIARGLIAQHPVLLLDEPTASLDLDNRRRVLALIDGARQKGAAIVGIFHDQAVREALCNRRFDMH